MVCSYWLFSAAVIILANLFSPVYLEGDSESAVRMALKIMRYCGEADPQARRYQTILETFFEALQEAEKVKDQATNQVSQTPDIFSMIFGNESMNVSGGESSVPATSVAPMAWPDGQFPTMNSTSGLDTLCFASGLNRRAGESHLSMDVLSGQGDNSIDNGDIWWGEGQDIFSNQVPLYGLMEPM